MLHTDMIKYPTQDEAYEILDRVRRIRFRGRMIGKASTQRDGGGPRWTDITIYRTEGGQYVIQREGISLVYHRADSSCRGGELVTNEQILEGSVPCAVCRPPGLDALDDIREGAANHLKIAALEQELGMDPSDFEGQTASRDPNRYRREVTMSSADVADDPNKIVPILTYQGRLTTVATDAIREAIRNDRRLDGIFDRVETIA